MKEKYVIVPQSDLDKIEAAREELWKTAEECGSINESDLIGITQKLWGVANRRYPEYEGEVTYEQK